MKCPDCGKDMEKGYLQGGLFLWSTKKHPVMLQPSRHERYACYLKPATTTPHALNSWYCYECKKMMVDCADCPDCTER